METRTSNRKGKTMKKAIKLKKLSGWQGEAIQYKVTPPMDYDDLDGDDTKQTSFVIVSAVVAMGSGLETFIFPATPDGEAINHLEMDGSMRGTLSHTAALGAAGYSL